MSQPGKPGMVIPGFLSGKKGQKTAEKESDGVRMRAETGKRNISKQKTAEIPGYKSVVGTESFVFIAGFAVFFAGLATRMGAVNMMNTMMNTAYDLLINTVFYIMAIAVLAGAIAGLLTEFGVVALINKLLSPLMKPLYGLPGAGVVGVFATYLSDNPAILTLAEDKGFRCYFKKYQLPALTNIGTSFGMGMIITAFMAGIQSPTGDNLVRAALLGNLGAVIGSIFSVRIMLHFTKKEYGTEEWCIGKEEAKDIDIHRFRKVRGGSVANRFMEALLEGGKSGVDMGMAIIPGVLIICTVVLMLSNGPSADGGYTGAAYEGIALLPWLGSKLEFILKPLFGFASPEAISVPVTALGAAGAAISLVPAMVKQGIASTNDVAVFTAMCMCWSGYLSTHVAMMDSLKCGKMTGKAILSHTIGGIVAGISAHLLFLLIG